jgi:ATPase family AAA domain-containing protein 3A/B
MLPTLGAAARRAATATATTATTTTTTTTTTLAALGLAAAATASSAVVVALADDKNDKTPANERPMSSAEQKRLQQNLFDPEALERGAKALREINQSPYAKQALELSRQQEFTKQAEAKKEEAEMRRAAAELARQTEAQRWEEQRRHAQEEAQRQAQLAQYNDELARKRMAAQHELERQRNAELVQMQEQSSAAREQERLRVEQQIQAERRAADGHAAELQKQVEREKALAEAEGRIKENRDNEDVNRRAALLRYQEETKKAVESINAVFGHLGNAARDVLADKEKAAALVVGATALALGVYGARESARVGGRVVDRWLGTPKLVRETSRVSLLQPGKALAAAARRLTSGGAGAKKPAEAVRKDFGDIVLPPALHDQVRSLAAAAANTKRHGAPYRHMLFYGPPGTGKTMAAKRLAQTSGMDYAILSGGDVAPLGGGAVTQLHETFDWAERTRRGLLLFVDEADAFLGRRSDAMSEGLRGALNATLYRTGDQSRDFMVVLATNRPGDLDDAVLDRMDEALEFGLPGEAQRRALVAQYLDRYVTRAGESGAGGAAGGPPPSLGERLRSLVRGRKSAADAIAVSPPDLLREDGALVKESARLMEGFSAREIAKFAASVQAAVYGGRAAQCDESLVRKVLQHKLDEHKARAAFVLGHHGAGEGAAEAGGVVGGGNKPPSAPGPRTV